MTVRHMLVVAASLLVVGCTRGPVDPETICRAALQGTNWGAGGNFTKCKQDVSWAAYQAGHRAAKPYRNLPR